MRYLLGCFFNLFIKIIFLFNQIIIKEIDIYIYILNRLSKINVKKILCKVIHVKNIILK
jgi:hypothetical protein